MSVNPTTGDRTLVSGTGAGSGPVLGSTGFAISGNNLYVASLTGASGNVIMKVDALTGDRTIIAGSGINGPDYLGVPGDIQLDAAGNLLVTAAVNGAIVRVDPITGSQARVSGFGVGSGPAIGLLGEQLGVATDGTIFIPVFDHPTQESVLRVNPTTGNRSILADGTHGTGPAFGPSGALLVVPSVPEPSTIVLAMMGAIALLIYRVQLIT